MRNFKNILLNKPKAEIVKRICVRLKYVNTIHDMFLVNSIKLFLSLNGKTSQQTKHPPSAITINDECGTYSVFVCSAYTM